jgi:hypothetical protein
MMLRLRLRAVPSLEQGCVCLVSPGLPLFVAPCCLAWLTREVLQLEMMIPIGVTRGRVGINAEYLDSAVLLGFRCLTRSHS